MLATKKGHVDVVSKLVACGANGNTADKVVNGMYCTYMCISLGMNMKQLLVANPSKLPVGKIFCWQTDMTDTTNCLTPPLLTRRGVIRVEEYWISITFLFIDWTNCSASSLSITQSDDC